MSEENKNTKVVKSNSLVHTIVYTLLIVAVAVLAFLYYSKSKSSVPKAVAKTQCDYFDELPQDVRQLYVGANEHLELKATLEKVESELQALQNSSEKARELKPTEDPMEFESMLEPSHEASDEKVMDQKLTRVEDIAKCYDMDNAGFKVSKECRKAIITYVDKHHDAKYFEIIGIVDNLEFNLFNNLENQKALYKKLGVDQVVIDKLKKYARRGLAKDRSSEASWVIKAHTKQKAATYNANYELISTKGYRGVVIRAYK